MKRIASVLLLTSLSAACSAQHHVGLGLGQGSFKLSCDGRVACQRDDTSVKAYLGYRLTQALSAELSYTDHGTSTLRTSINGAVVHTRIDHSSVGLAAVVRHPLAADWTAVGRLGISQIRTRFDNSYAGMDLGSETTHSTRPFFGLGLEYALAKGWSTVLSADLSHAKAGASEGRLRTVNVGLQYAR